MLMLAQEAMVCAADASDVGYVNIAFDCLTAWLPFDQVMQGYTWISWGVTHCCIFCVHMPRLAGTAPRNALTHCSL